MDAKFVVTMPSEEVVAFCTQDSYRFTVPNPEKTGKALNDDSVPAEIDNPETPADYVQRRVFDYLHATAVAGKSQIRKQRPDDAEKMAREADIATSAAAIAIKKE